MSQTAEFNIPNGMSPERVARAFSAYLQGHTIFEGSRKESGTFYGGPFKKERRNETSWQLDISNDYWLHIFGTNRAAISCRYPSQVPILEAVVHLFNACYSLNSEANSK